jgi:hypothetical protein
MSIDWLLPSPLPWVPQNIENKRLGIRNRCKIFLRKGLEIKIFIKKDLGWQFRLGYSPSSQTCVNELNNLATRLCRCCGDGSCFSRSTGSGYAQCAFRWPIGHTGPTYKRSSKLIAVKLRKDI